MLVRDDLIRLSSKLQAILPKSTFPKGEGNLLPRHSPKAFPFGEGGTAKP